MWPLGKGHARLELPYVVWWNAGRGAAMRDARHAMRGCHVTEHPRIACRASRIAAPGLLATGAAAAALRGTGRRRRCRTAAFRRACGGRRADDAARAANRTR